MRLFDSVTNFSLYAIYLLMFLDFKKAFDTVNHDRLIDKLSWYGIRGIAQLWFKNFLLERMQKTVFNSAESSSRLVECGVPQGSILGPLLYIIYVNDMQRVLSHCQISLYADDTALYIPGARCDEVESLLQQDLNRISRWLVSNKLFLNVGKSKSMLVGSKFHRDIGTPLTIHCGGEELEEVSSYKYLGVMVDKHVTFEAHAEYISGKVSKRLGSLSRSRKYMNSETSLMLYKSLVVSLFDYCDTVYQIMLAKDLAHLQVLQNKACRIILQQNRFSHASDLHCDLKLPYLSQRRELHTLVIMYKIVSNTAPPYLTRMIKPIEDRPAPTATRGAETYLLELPLFRTNKGQGAFSFLGPRYWNSLPQEIRMLVEKNKNIFRDAVIEWQHTQAQ